MSTTVLEPVDDRKLCNDGDIRHRPSCDAVDIRHRQLCNAVRSLRLEGWRLTHHDAGHGTANLYRGFNPVFPLHIAATVLTLGLWLPVLFVVFVWFLLDRPRRVGVQVADDGSVWARYSAEPHLAAVRVL